MAAAAEAGEKKYVLVLLRHGQSVYNEQNRFCVRFKLDRWPSLPHHMSNRIFADLPEFTTFANPPRMQGWHDAALTELGHQEAVQAGKLLQEGGYKFDRAYTSVLKRAIGTLWHVLEETDQMWIPVSRTWRLNERHYGALQGLNKAETAEKHGKDQVHVWRRSYATPPPSLETSDERHPAHEDKYRGVDEKLLPAAESLKLTGERFLPVWDDEIAPRIKAGEKILIAAHGNSLRALVKMLDDVSEEDITGLNIPTGVPLVYELDAELKPVRHYYLGDPEEAAAKAKAVAAQASGGGGEGGK